MHREFRATEHIDLQDFFACHFVEMCLHKLLFCGEGLR